MFSFQWPTLPDYNKCLKMWPMLSRVSETLVELKYLKLIYEKYWRWKHKSNVIIIQSTAPGRALLQNLCNDLSAISFPFFSSLLDGFPCKCTADQFLPPNLPISLTSCRQGIINLHLYWTKRPWCSPKALYCSSVVNMDHDFSFLCLQCAEFTLAGVSPFEGII